MKRAGRLTARPTRTIPTTLLALLLVIVGLTGIWLLGSYLIDGAWPQGVEGVIAYSAALPWEAPAVVVVASVTACLGLIFFVSALVPGDPANRAILAGGIPSDTPGDTAGDIAGDAPGDTVVSSRDLARRVRQLLERVDGVQSAQVSVRRSRLAVTVRTVAGDVDAVRRRSHSVVDEALTQLRPVRAIRPRVRVIHAS